MRCSILVTAALAAMAFTSMSATGAQAQPWCGFTVHLGAVVQCGYSSQQACENAVGKGAMCFINPYLVLNEPSPRPELRSMQRSKARA